MRSTWSVVLLLGVLMLVLPAASAAPWLQQGHDPTGTSATDDPGPAWGDIALQVPMPGYPAYGGVTDASPLIIERHVYVLVDTTEGNDKETEAGSIVRVDVDTGQIERIAQVDGDVSHQMLSSDGERLFVTVEGPRVLAYPIEGGEPLWDQDIPVAPVREPTETLCASLAVAGGSLTVGCYKDRVTEVLGCGGCEAANVVARLEATTGELVWTWTHDGTAEVEMQAGSPVALERAGPTTAPAPIVLGVAVLGTIVAVQTFSVRGNDLELNLWALDNATGSFRWAERSQPVSFVPLGPAATTQGTYAAAYYPGRPSGAQNVVYAKLDGFQVFGLGDGQELDRQAIGGEDINEFRPFFNDGQLGIELPTTNVAVHGGSAFVASLQNVYRFPLEDGGSGWRTSLPTNSQAWFDAGPVVTPSTLYLATRDTDGIGALYAFDAQQGALLWTVPATFAGEPAIGGELMAFTQITGPDTGDLVVVGRTDASPTPKAAISTTYPSPGERVSVDLSDSQAGLQGPVTRYKAIWGDGTETDWQTDPALTHTYGEPGDRTARFVVGNDANQTASTTHTFHVGATAPNAIETAFARENQDLTFGVLGILVAVLGGLVAIARRRTRRGRLQRELDAIDALAERAAGDAAELEAMVRERRAHVRALVVDGKLDEGQGQVLERRLDEVQRANRLDEVEDLLDTLPHGLVRHLREVLADGRVTRFERDSLLSLVEQDGLVPDELKGRVRDRIERWFQRDAGVRT